MNTVSVTVHWTINKNKAYLKNWWKNLDIINTIYYVVATDLMKYDTLSQIYNIALRLFKQNRPKKNLF